MDKHELIRRMEQRDRERDGWNAALGDALPMPLDASYEKRAAGRTPTIYGDVLVPLAQAAICGLTGAIVGGLLFRSWTAAGVGAALAFVGAWVLLLASTRQLLYAVEKLERLTGTDLNRDGHVGAPEPRTVRVEIVEPSKAGGRIQYLNLPTPEPKLRDVARAVLATGAPFSRRGLSGVLSQDEYSKLSQAMVSAGLAVDLPGNRRELTAAGRSVLKELLQ